MFVGLMEAIVLSKGKEAWHVSMQNFKYVPAWEELAHTLAVQSLKAYKILAEHFPAPSFYHFQ